MPKEIRMPCVFSSTTDVDGSGLSWDGNPSNNNVGSNLYMPIITNG